MTPHRWYCTLAVVNRQIFYWPPVVSIPGRIYGAKLLAGALGLTEGAAYLAR